MPTATIDTAEFRKIIREELRKVLREEEFALFISRLPVVSDEEMAEIERLHGEPCKKQVYRSVTVEL